MKFTKIEYLPKFYSRADVKEKNKTLKICIKELKATGVLKEKEIDEINDFDLTLCADAYSRNYEIRRVKELQEFANCRI